MIFQAEEAKVKISEVSGERVDNEAKLKVISQEEEAIKKEKEVWIICTKQTRHHYNIVSGNGIMSLLERIQQRLVKPGLHATFFTPFFSSFKNALNEFLWCCSHMTLK